MRLLCAARGTESRRNAHFTCFTSTKSTNTSTKVLSCYMLRPTAQAAVAQFTCFTSTKVLALLVQKYAPATCSALCARRETTRCPGILNIDAHAHSVIDMSCGSGTQFPCFTCFTSKEHPLPRHPQQRRPRPERNRYVLRVWYAGTRSLLALLVQKYTYDMS
jgi:hypothetical protein